jgi:hypothetical protein
VAVYKRFGEYVHAWCTQEHKCTETDLKVLKPFDPYVCSTSLTHLD